MGVNKELLAGSLLGFAPVVLDLLAKRIVRRKGTPAKALRYENNRYMRVADVFFGYACKPSPISSEWDVFSTRTPVAAPAKPLDLFVELSWQNLAHTKTKWRSHRMKRFV
ncbi:MAG: hypothetical protein KGQ60_15650 [Planctomycetes bacterium]|nr:hypothetical protein [Planctomycetota bacterium]